MTNLLEKALLIGFGLFTLTLFFILVAPFFGKITDFKENDKKDLDDYNKSMIVIFYENNSNIESLEELSFVNGDYLRYLERSINKNYISLNLNQKENTFKIILGNFESLILKSYLKKLYLNFNFIGKKSYGQFKKLFKIL